MSAVNQLLAGSLTRSFSLAYEAVNYMRSSRPTLGLQLWLLCTNFPAIPTPSLTISYSEVQDDILSFYGIHLFTPFLSISTSKRCKYRHNTFLRLHYTF